MARTIAKARPRKKVDDSELVARGIVCAGVGCAGLRCGYKPRPGVTCPDELRIVLMLLVSFASSGTVPIGAGGASGLAPGPDRGRR